MEKIWGLYNSYTEPDHFTKDEFFLWEKISFLEIFIKDFKGNEELQYNYEFLVYSTRNFGVKFDEEPTETKHVKKSDSYYEWYNYWTNHFRNMDKFSYCLFLNDKACKKDVSKYMPSEPWNAKHKEKLK